MRLGISGILTLVILIKISVFKREVNTLETDGKATVASFPKTTDIFQKILPHELHPWFDFHEQVKIPFLRK